MQDFHNLCYYVTNNFNLIAQEYIINIDKLFKSRARTPVLPHTHVCMCMWFFELFIFVHGMVGHRVVWKETNQEVFLDNHRNLFILSNLRLIGKVGLLCHLWFPGSLLLVVGKLYSPGISWSVKRPFVQEFIKQP